MTSIIVPALGESVSEATVAKWLKKVGDAVKVDEALVELETDKVTLEVVAAATGVLADIKVQAGASVAVGTILGEITAGAAGAVSAPAPAPAPTPTASPAATAPAPTKAPTAQNETSLSPAVRKMVDDNKLDAATIAGTGKDGRILKADVMDHMSSGGASSQAAVPHVVATGPREERVKMTRLRQRIAERLKEAQNTAAMLTTFNEVDMSACMALRSQYKDVFEKKHGVKLGFMSFFVRAAIQALKEFPAVNASIDGTDIIYKNYYDIGVAVSTPTGLVVPVLRDADVKSMAEIENEIAGLGLKARDGKLSMAELQGGTFTITNGGVFGSLMSTPILNTPQSGILGMHKIQERPIAVKGQVVIRPMMYIALSYDHRIIDGREAVSFLVRVKDAIEDPQRLLLDI
jgi:2-oxoglutarate dehydrogenase E2 component (dihydrolipoamide succinyltransferase)